MADVFTGKGVDPAPVAGRRLAGSAEPPELASSLALRLPASSVLLPLAVVVPLFTADTAGTILRPVVEIFLCSVEIAYIKASSSCLSMTLPRIGGIPHAPILRGLGKFSYRSTVQFAEISAVQCVATEALVTSQNNHPPTDRLLTQNRDSKNGRNNMNENSPRQAESHEGSHEQQLGQLANGRARDSRRPVSKRRMSNNMSGPLSGMSAGTTLNAQVTNACLPVGQLPNKTPIFIPGVKDTRAFLAWLRAFCPGGLMAQLKSEKLMVVPQQLTGSAPRSVRCGPLMGRMV